MSVYNAIYLSLIIAALLLAAHSFRSGRKQSVYILAVLAATLLVELFSTLAITFKLDFSWSYHLFNPVEYSLFCLYYLQSCEMNKFKTAVRYSIPFFIGGSLLASAGLYRFRSMPAANINAEGFILFILYTHLLFCIETDQDTPVYRHPDFWIAIGVLIFFGGAFVFLGLYPFLFDLDFGATMNLFGAITRPLNLVFYSCIIIGLLCSMQKKKYSL